MADSTIPGLIAIAAPLAAGDLLSVRRGGQTRNEKAAMTDLATVLAAAGPAPLAGYLTAVPAATGSVTGGVKLALDFAGSAALPKVAGWLGNPLDVASMGSPTNGKAPVWNSTDGEWEAITLPVAGGGLGLASLTAYAVLAGGTTSTGAVQQVSGLGTAGQVLTSNGAAALPTWQAAAGGGANTALSNLAAVAISAPLATGPGVVFAGSTTAQAAAAASAAGLGLTLTADSAVAGTSTAGAAQGGDWTATAGAAARLTSGNARGGNIQLIPGAGIGTGLAGMVCIGGMTDSFPALAQRPGNQDMELMTGARGGRNNLWVSSIRVNSTVANYSSLAAYLNDPGGNGYALGLAVSQCIGWTNGADASQSKDTGFCRPFPGSISLDTTARANGLGRLNQRTSTAANPTTTEFPNNKDWGIHQNTASGAIFLAFNNNGTIVSVQLS